jgi:Secretion system C-terminal sorting domain
LKNHSFYVLNALILCFSLFSTSIKAQNPDFALIGAYWKYSWAAVSSGGEAVAEVTGDTLINGRVFKKIDMRSYQYPPPGYTRGFTQTYRLAHVEIRNDSIFSISGLNNGLLHTTNIRLGDTIKFPTISNYVRYALTDSFGFVNQGGVTSRVVYFSQYCLNTNNGQLRKYGNPRITENAGLLGQLLLRSQPDCGFIDNTQYSLTCYQVGSVRFPINQVCASTVATNDAVSDPQITLAPNPASNELSVNYPSDLRLTHVELVNNLGQIISVNASENKQKINVLNIPDGIYLLRLQFDNQQVVKKIIIQH